MAYFTVRMPPTAGLERKDGKGPMLGICGPIEDESEARDFCNKSQAEAVLEGNEYDGHDGVALFECDTEEEAYALGVIHAREVWFAHLTEIQKMTKLVIAGKDVRYHGAGFVATMTKNKSYKSRKRRSR